jgi:hypothetical protein
MGMVIGYDTVLVELEMKGGKTGWEWSIWSLLGGGRLLHYYELIYHLALETKSNFANHDIFWDETLGIHHSLFDTKKNKYELDIDERACDHSINS